nr:MAG TPA: hypothetical protein [Caudoviricetes sp.]
MIFFSSHPADLRPSISLAISVIVMSLLIFPLSPACHWQLVSLFLTSIIISLLFVICQLFNHLF